MQSSRRGHQSGTLVLAGQEELEVEQQKDKGLEPFGYTIIPRKGFYSGFFQNLLSLKVQVNKPCHIRCMLVHDATQ